MPFPFLVYALMLKEHILKYLSAEWYKEVIFWDYVCFKCKVFIPLSYLADSLAGYIILDQKLFS